MSADAIIERGYFPWELPPCFRTVELAQYVTSVGLQQLLSKHKAQWTRPARHNLARPGGLRRALSIPNPLNFLHLSSAVDAAWVPYIDPLLDKSTLSITRPVPSLGPRAFAPQSTYGDSEAKASARSSARVLLKADIQNFYPSVYTHSIPWVLNTKAVAKANIKNPNLPGNEIDKALREAQDGQTMGIPIGCDTSWVLAECILARVEEGLHARLGKIRGHRYTDDFELLFRSASEAEAAMGIFQEVLAEYELSVNPRKTRISDLPDLIEGRGVSELRRWKFRSHSSAQKTDIIGYFDLLTEHVIRERGGHIASYAVARLRNQQFLSSSWPLLEALLLQLLVSEPFSAKQVAMTLSMLTAAGHSVDPTNLAEAAERMVVYHAPLGHGSEVAWALWLSLSHKAKITQLAANAVATMDDCFVALLALHAKTHSGINGHLNTAFWEQAMIEDELIGSRWLLSYEARLKGWLPSKNTANHVLGNPFFADLFANTVSFYDTSALSLSFQPHQLIPAIGGGGGPSPVPGDT
jgi:hypothetical protein